LKQLRSSLLVLLVAFGGLSPIVGTALPLQTGGATAPASTFTVADSSGLSGRIAFTAAIGAEEQILVLDLDANRVRRLIDGPGSNQWPSFSPDGTTLAFASNRDGPWEIYRAAWDGSDQRRLTSSPQNKGNPAYVPTGERIIFYAESARSSDDTNIFSVGSDGRGLEQVTTLTGRNTTPRLTPDGRSVTYSTNRFWPGWDVCSWDLRSRQESCLLTGTQTFCRQTHSPDGRKIAYSHGSFSRIDLWVLDTVTQERRRLTELSGKDYDATWSPDGRYLAFTSDTPTTDRYALYVIPLDGEGAREPRLLLSGPHSIRFLSWSAVTTLELEARRIKAADGGAAPGASLRGGSGR